MPAVIPILIGVTAIAAAKRNKGQKTIRDRVMATRDAIASAPKPTAEGTAAPTVGTPAPPDAGVAASNAAGAARLAADRQRKRGSASTLLTQPKATGTGPRASLRPRTLIGY